MTIHLDVNDSNADLFLNILKSLKSDIVERFVIIKSDDSCQPAKIDTSHIEKVSDEENEYYENLLNNMTEDDKEVAIRKTYAI